MEIEFVHNPTPELVFDGLSDRLLICPQKLMSMILATFLVAISLFSYRTYQPKTFMGPIPGAKEHFMSFTGVPSFDGSVDLDRVYELSVSDFSTLVLNSIPYHLRERLRPHLPHALAYASKYKIDPFWALSIMWTESHYNIKAVSSVKAQGLMQVMPQTAYFIYRLMGRKISLPTVMKIVQDPASNIEMGTFYLDMLLKKFKGSHLEATVGYNMGPYWVLKRKRRNLPVGTKNHYLDKVRIAYKIITQTFIAYQQNTPKAFENSYVAESRKAEGRRFLYELMRPFEFRDINRLAYLP